MKKLAIPTLAAIILLFFVASKPHQQNNDTEQVKAVLNKFFDSINTHNIDDLKSTTTSDFILYEDGKLWNIDSAAMNVKRHLPFSVKYQISNLRIFIDSKSADATYSNHADFKFSAGAVSLDWIESATFRKINGEWKINFLGVTVKK